MARSESNIGNTGDKWVQLELVTVLIATSVILFYSILLGITGTLAELNSILPVIAIAIVVLAYALATDRISPERLRVRRFVYYLISGLVIAFLVIIMLLVTSRDLYLTTITPFITSTYLYMMLGLMTALAIFFSYKYRGQVEFFTWRDTKLARDSFFVGVGLWFVVGMTTFLSVFVSHTPFETTPFLGVPFSAVNIQFPSEIIQATVIGLSGFLEAGFFFTIILGVLSISRLSTLAPTDLKFKLVFIVLTSLAFAYIILILHTGMHDLSQSDVLFFIALFFLAGSVNTMFWNTSFSFMIAQGLLDFLKSLWSSGNPAMAQLAWVMFALFSVLALVGLFLWAPWRRIKGRR